MIKSKQITNAKPWFFNAKIPFVDFSKKEINRGPHNSGWGVSWLDKNNNWKIFKEGKNEVNIYNFDKVKNIKSKSIAIHLRWASVGSETSKNAQPLNYGDFIFMHNGTIEKKELIKSLNNKFKKEIKTDSDSEIYFLLIMQFLEETNSLIDSIKKTLKLIKKYPYTGLNFILSNKDNIYAYRDFDKSKKEFFNYYTLNYLNKDKQIILSSDPLSEDNWIPFKVGELINIDKDLKIKRLKL